MGRFNPREFLSIDTETTGLHFWQGDRPFAVPLCDEEGNTWYTEWDVNPQTREVTPNDSDLRYLRRLFENERLPKLLFNLKFDYRMLAAFGLILKGPLHDVGVAARICNTLEPSYRLKQLAAKYCDIPTDDQTQLQRAVVRARNYGRKHGWNLAEDTEADYWTPRASGLDDGVCETYALGDVERNRMLWFLYRKVVMEDPESPELLDTYRFEMEEVWPVVYRMEQRGVRLDRRINSQELKKSQERQVELYNVMLAMLKRDRISWSPNPKEPFKPGSDIQLRRILFDRRHGYGLVVHRYTEKSKEPSTDWKALREHLTHAFVQTLVQWRSARKAESTYFGAYERLIVEDHISPGEWTIHGSFNQLGAAKTGRLSSNDPNLQNVGDANNNPNSPAPIQAREPFGPRKGYVWYCFDYSGQEMRIFADVARIQTMLEAFYSGRSVHDHNAELAWGGKGNPHALTAAAYSLELGASRPSRKEVAEVWRELEWNETKARLYGFDSPKAQAAAEAWLSDYDYSIIKAESSIGLKRAKTRAKNLGFAKIYGAGVNGVVDMLYCSRYEARQLLDRFDEIHPGMVEFMNELCVTARSQGFIHNLFGRRLMVDGYTAYKATNYLVQGTAADMIKRAMVRAQRYIDGTGLDIHLEMSVHDELDFEIRKDHTHLWVLRGLKRIMESVKPKALRIPMPVEVNRIRHGWNEKEPLEL
jgi:DNA polymerase I-like protein with 3'-5' exonuclease and polymerase domains